MAEVEDIIIGGGGQHEGHLDARLLEQYSNHLNFELSANHFLDTIQARLDVNGDKQRLLKPGKDYRRTEEQVLDNRTKIVLFKLLHRGIMSEIDGCISTGKEGNVYIGHKGPKAPEDWPDTFAIKIYKTCILKFKDRDRYVRGEMRFRNQSSSRNSRKSVILWAEKEFRNLHRYHREGIPSPRPLLVKGNIILMELIQEHGEPAPILKLSNSSFEDFDRYYIEIVRGMRKAYQKCLLIHADLSEYNLLVRDGHVVFIDVGQAVETDNENATVFLRNDITVITKFFKSLGVKTAPLMRVFEFVAEPKLLAAEEWVLKEIREMEETMSYDEFNGIFIPQRLDQVADPDQETEDVDCGMIDNAALHGALTGIVRTELARENLDMLDSEDLEMIEQDIEEEEEEDADEEEDGPKKETLDRKNYTKEEWKEIQKKIKEERKEKRKTKTPKYVKKKEYKRSHPNAK